MKEQFSSTTQGNIGLAQAIAWFCKSNFIVSIPLSRHQSYDLLVDDQSGKIQKIKVVSTFCKVSSGSFQANLRVIGGNNGKDRKIKNFNPLEIDYLFIICELKEFYLIPSSKVNAKTRVNLNSYKDFKCIPD